MISINDLPLYPHLNLLEAKASMDLKIALENYNHDMGFDRYDIHLWTVEDPDKETYHGEEVGKPLDRALLKEGVPEETALTLCYW